MPVLGTNHFRGGNMKLTKLATAAIAIVMTLGAGTVSADLVFPSLSYRTGPYAPNGIPFADGYADYFTLLNERDGGIGGAPINVIECETGYNTEKGVECFPRGPRGTSRYHNEKLICPAPDSTLSGALPFYTVARTVCCENNSLRWPPTL